MQKSPENPHHEVNAKDWSQSRLSCKCAPNGIIHPMDSDLLLDLDSCHVLRGDQDVLPVIRGLCAVNLESGVVRVSNMFFREVSWPTIIRMLIRLLTASMKTSNSSRHRRGYPIDSHSERRRHIAEKDFSPPLRVFGSLSPLCVPTISSV